MRHAAPKHNGKKNPRNLLALLLAGALMVSLSVAPAGAADSTPLQDSPSSAVSEMQNDRDASSASALPSEQPEVPESSQPSLQKGESSSADSSLPSDSSEDSSSGEPEIKTYTVSFDTGASVRVEEIVEEGGYPSSVPAALIPPMATFIGWFDENGKYCVPEYTAITRDTKYTARFSRELTDLLNTQEHIAYIGGYQTGTFRPMGNVSRAEAAQMLYKLLKLQDWGDYEFSDVPPGQWYEDSVKTMAALGIVKGYADQTFRPNKAVTRAEFVKMVVSFTALSETAPAASFSDVPADNWAAPYIATAHELGWIDGFGDGTFHPGDPITRAQAVTILNKVLGRMPDSSVKNKTDIKNFYDVFPTYWAYSQIAEASTEHSYTTEEGTETWTEYTPDTSVVKKSAWVTDHGGRYFLDAKTRKFLRGTFTVDGVSYLTDSSTGRALSGFRVVGSYRRYYKDGVIQNDISGLNLVSGPYFIKVYKPANYLIVFAKDGSGNYNTPVRAMRTSCGYGTPCGTFYTPSKYRWLQMVGDTWAQWCTQISGNYLFHSVPNWTKNNADLEVDEYNHLGDTRSLGCIRLNCRDAKWLYDNCSLGTEVFIAALETSGPLAKPNGLQIPGWHSWDPTDPTAYWRCQQNGCH